MSFGLIALVPTLFDQLPGPARLAINVLRWVVLLVGMMLGLAVVYRLAPDRDDAKWRWVTPGALLATCIWLLGSVLLSVYSANIGKFNETYGSLGVVVVLMIWLLIAGIAVILGAELNAELERQTTARLDRRSRAADGRRNAHAADTLGTTAEQVDRRDGDVVAAPTLGGTDPREPAHHTPMRRAMRGAGPMRRQRVSHCLVANVAPMIPGVDLDLLAAGWMRTGWVMERSSLRS